MNIKFLLNEWVILSTMYQNLILVVFIDHLHKINLFLIFPQCLSTSSMASVAEHFLAIWSLLSLSLLDSSAVLYGWSWEPIAPTVANRQWSVHVGCRRSYVYPQCCLRGGLGCRVDDVGCVKCECVCDVESDPKSRGYMGDTTGKQFPMGWSSDQFNWGCNMIRSC